MATLPMTTPPGDELGPLSGDQRADKALEIKIKSAEFERNKPIPKHKNNGDEQALPGFVGNFHKGLPTINQFGEVNPVAYKAMLDALSSGLPAGFERIPLGGTAKLTNPQAGLAFDTEGIDSHQIHEPPSPGTASHERAAEAVENYWMALTRDVAFSAYGTEALSQAAISELSSLGAFKGVQPVTAKNLFRIGMGDPQFTGMGTFSDMIGPFISQFLLVPRNLGSHQYTAEMKTYLGRQVGGVDYLTDEGSWRAAQQGNVNTNDSANIDPIPRFVRNGRDMSQWVHMDLLYEGYLEADMVLNTYNAPLSKKNPYLASKTQVGFGTLGGPFAQSLFAEVARRALQAQWFQKWYVHRALRPEAYGGLVHFQITKGRYPFIPKQVLNSQAVQQTFSQYGSYLLPIAFPEGSPTHPSYGAGHATVAGACVTILKALYEESTVIGSLFQPVESTPDGLSLANYTGADVGQMTIGSELNKVAMNVANGRNIAGVHWHSDAVQSLFVGENVAVSVLQDVKKTLNELKNGGGNFEFHDFRGKLVTI